MGFVPSDLGEYEKAEDDYKRGVRIKVLNHDHDMELNNLSKYNEGNRNLKKCGADGWVEKYEKELVALS